MNENYGERDLIPAKYLTLSKDERLEVEDGILRHKRGIKKINRKGFSPLQNDYYHFLYLMLWRVGRSAWMRRIVQSENENSSIVKIGAGASVHVDHLPHLIAQKHIEDWARCESNIVKMLQRHQRERWGLSDEGINKYMSLMFEPEGSAARKKAKARVVADFKLDSARNRLNKRPSRKTPVRPRVREIQVIETERTAVKRLSRVLLGTERINVREAARLFHQPSSVATSVVLQTDALRIQTKEARNAPRSH